MTQEQQEKLLEELFRAYFEARKNKRGTANAVIFELDHEDKLIELFHELLNREYQLSPSICFINHHPVKREIFAAGFRDRIVHHWPRCSLSPEDCSGFFTPKKTVKIPTWPPETRSFLDQCKFDAAMPHALTTPTFLSRVKTRSHSSFIICHEKTGKRKNYIKNYVKS